MVIDLKALPPLEPRRPTRCQCGAVEIPAGVLWLVTLSGEHRPARDGRCIR